MSNRRDIQFTYNPHNKATILDCSFKVAAADTGGLGITGLKQSGRIANVFMHTSQTAGLGNNGITNPNPQAGIILVQMQDNYNSFLHVSATARNPQSGSDISSGMTAGNVYVISVLGNTTAAAWVTAGVPAYITPAIGVAFVSKVTSFAGTGRVQALAAAGAGVCEIEKIGSSGSMNSTGANVAGSGVGMQLFLGCYKQSISGTSSAPVLTMDSYTPAGVITNGTPDTFAGTPAVLTGSVAAPTFTGTAVNALANPADGSIIYLKIYLNNSAQGV